MIDDPGGFGCPDLRRTPFPERGAGFFVWGYGDYRTRAIVGKNPIVIANFNFVREN